MSSFTIRTQQIKTNRGYVQTRSLMITYSDASAVGLIDMDVDGTQFKALTVSETEASAANSSEAASVTRTYLIVQEQMYRERAEVRAFVDRQYDHVVNLVRRLQRKEQTEMAYKLKIGAEEMHEAMHTSPADLTDLKADDDTDEPAADRSTIRSMD